MRLLSEKELKTEKGVSYSHAHLRRLVVAGKFPAPLKIGENRNAWISEEVDRWIEERIAERDFATRRAAAKEEDAEAEGAEAEKGIDGEDEEEAADARAA